MNVAKKVWILASLGMWLFMSHRVAMGGELRRFDWVSHGKLFEEADKDSGRSLFHLYYGDNIESAHNVTNDPAAATSVVVEELGWNAMESNSLRNSLGEFIYYAMLEETKTKLIDSRYLFEYKRQLAWDRDKAKADFDRLLVGVPILKKYAAVSRAPTITNGIWRTEIYVVTGWGAVERWTARGVIAPFSISGYSKEEVEKKGSVFPLISI